MALFAGMGAQINHKFQIYPKKIIGKSWDKFGKYQLNRAA
jgi:hypothetical protein